VADHHHADHVPPPRRVRMEKPLAPLWSVTKGEHQRHARLHGHELGFELRIVGERGEFVFTQVRGSEPEIVMLAATHHDAYKAKGWEPLEKPE
jgi:hypothetical protein